METIFFWYLCFAFNFLIIFTIFQNLIFVILELQPHPPKHNQRTNYSAGSNERLIKKLLQ